MQCVLSTGLGFFYGEDFQTEKKRKEGMHGLFNFFPKEIRKGFPLTVLPWNFVMTHIVGVNSFCGGGGIDSV